MHISLGISSEISVSTGVSDSLEVFRDIDLVTHSINLFSNIINT